MSNDLYYDFLINATRMIDTQPLSFDINTKKFNHIFIIHFPFLIY